MGVMGAPMAGHLAKAGNQVTVWNRTPSKAAPALEHGAKEVSSIEELTANSDIIISCVGRSEDVQEVVLKTAQFAKPGTLFIDQSTIEPQVAKQLHEELASKGLRFVDAPVTGGSMGASAGTLTIFCGGDEADVEEAIDAMVPYTKRSARVGGPGAGQTMKLANQIAVGGALLGLCESMAFAKKAGLDISQAHDMIGGGAGGSWAFANYGPKLLAQDWTPGFSVKNQRKDFNYCEAAAEQFGIEIAMTEVANRLLAKLQDAGREEDTTAALYEVYLGL